MCNACVNGRAHRLYCGPSKRGETYSTIPSQLITSVSCWAHKLVSMFRLLTVGLFENGKVFVIRDCTSTTVMTAMLAEVGCEGIAKQISCRG